MGLKVPSLWKICAESNLYGADSTQKFKKKNFNMWPKDCFCGILVKNVAAFCLCMKSLAEAKVKRFMLITLTKEISTNPSRLCSLFKCHEQYLNKHSKVTKEKYIIYGIKRAPECEM